MQMIQFLGLFPSMARVVVVHPVIQWVISASFGRIDYGGFPL